MASELTKEVSKRKIDPFTTFVPFGCVLALCAYFVLAPENSTNALEVIRMKKPQVRARAKEVMGVVGLSEKGNAFPHELSGGQQQRVAIARAIANRPKVLIADEPTGNLDPGKSDEIMDLLERINERYGTTILMVTHDLTLVNKHRKRTVVLEHGHIVADLAEGGYVRHDQ